MSGDEIRGERRHPVGYIYEYGDERWVLELIPTEQIRQASVFAPWGRTVSGDWVRCSYRRIGDDA